MTTCSRRHTSHQKGQCPTSKTDKRLCSPSGCYPEYISAAWPRVDRRLTKLACCPLAAWPTVHLFLLSPRAIRTGMDKCLKGPYLTQMLPGLADMGRFKVTQLEHVGPRKQSPPERSCITLRRCLTKPSAVKMSCRRSWKTRSPTLSMYTCTHNLYIASFDLNTSEKSLLIFAR